MQFKKQNILIRISFLYSKVESSIFLLYLKNFSSLEKILFATIIKAKIVNNKIIRDAKTIKQLRIIEFTTTKELVNLYKYKNNKYTNKNKEECYSSNNKLYKFDQKNINN